MDWGAIIAGLMTAVVSVTTLVIANRSNQKQADRRLQADAREHRFDARLDAVVALDQAAAAQYRSLRDFIENHSDMTPAEWNNDDDPSYSPAEFLAAQARVRILATPDVIDRAADLFKGLETYWNHGQDGPFKAALDAFHLAAHSMLNADPTVPPAARRAGQVDPPAAERAQSITSGSSRPSVAEAAPPAENAQHVSEEGGGESPVRA